MAGILFEYFDGYLRVMFKNAHWSGDIDITFHISGDTVATTPCDDSFNKGEPEIDVNADAWLHCWTSSSMSCFFYSMISWLEAVTRDVAECAFFWEGEGPDGELRWFRGVRESGLLQMKWTGGRDSKAFEHQVRLNQYQMVKAFYQSFRSFVESDHYDPLHYEQLTLGEVFDLTVMDGRDACVQEIASREHLDAYALIRTIIDFAHDYEKEYPRRLSLSELIKKSQTYWEKIQGNAEEISKQADHFLNTAWSSWTLEQRRRYATEELCSLDGYGDFGEKLRELRSPLIESWLEEQAHKKVTAQIAAT